MRDDQGTGPSIEYSALSNDLDDFELVCARRPLIMWRAWDAPLPRTSQRRCMALLKDSKEIGIFGGNRSGKTELCRALVVALCNGSDHPDSIMFWKGNGLNPKDFPKGPDVGWAIAISSNDSLRYHRRQILDLIPKWGPRHPESSGEGKNWHAWNLFGRGEARLQWMVPGYDKPAEIWFKSEDQDIMTFQGDAIRVAWHDEEGATDRRYEQVQYRLIDKDGWQIMSDTPIHGRTWVYNRFILKRDAKNKPIEGSIVHGSLHSIDNPTLPRHRVAKIAGDAVRGKGEFVVLSGRIWGEFGHLHKLKPFQVRNEDCVRFRSIDFGTRHPFVCLWGAMLKRSIQVEGRTIRDGSLIIYRERYVSECTLADHVDAIREAEGYYKVPATVNSDGRRTGATWLPSGPDAEIIEVTWADPEDPQQMLQLNMTYDLPVIPGMKDIMAGILAIKARMAPDETGEPSIYVMENCENTIREWEDYQWVKSYTAEGVERDEPSKRSDHTCDAARYMTMGVDLGFA